MRPKTIEELFDDVRSIHFLSYIRYLYFNVGRIAYLQANVLSAYVFLAPAIVAGVVTLGVMQQIIRAFGRVEGSMQYLLKAWPTIIELLSVYKRLREFEAQIRLAEGGPGQRSGHRGRALYLEMMPVLECAGRGGDHNVTATRPDDVTANHILGL